ncbi:MAG: choice-of-anchor Q domain-containing protein, partial [Cyanobacteria bacterium J06648_11]
GIFNLYSTSTVSNSTVSGNSAADDGGGIANDFSTSTVSNSTVSGNSAADDGGGIFNLSSTTFTVSNSTVSGNSATSDGGGIYNRSASTAIITSSIVGDNTAANNPDLSNPGGSLVVSHSLIESASGNGLLSGINNNIVGFDPQLDPNGLQDNGGPTQTIALLPTSPAIDAGSNLAGLNTDQRGLDRTVGSGIDIGAFEVAPPLTHIVVDTLEDSVDGDFSAGDRSLREALGFIAEGGVITFDSSLSNDTITLNGSELLVDRAVAIDGESTNITLDANGASRVLRIDDGDNANAIAVSLSGLTLTGGSTSGSGGGIFNRESLLLADSTVSGNSAADDGGGIFNRFSTSTISNSTVSGNSAGDGGGIFNDFSTSTVSNSTVSSNSAADDGGGIYNGFS